MRWETHGRSWPHNAASHFFDVRPHRWHVQILGCGPDLLLLHGTGASTHSWAGVMEILAESYRVIAVDLPGHGFTSLGNRHRSRPATMATDLWALIGDRGWMPSTVIGHSAGVALALAMVGVPAQSREIDRIIGVNAALEGFEGAAGWAFPIAARAMASAPGLTAAIARLAKDPKKVRQMLASTGSEIDDQNLACYAALFSDAKHLDGTMLMMSQWSTGSIGNALQKWPGSLILMTGELDRTVAPRVSKDASRKSPRGQHVNLGAFGHLVHEEDPALTARTILGVIRD